MPQWNSHHWFRWWLVATRLKISHAKWWPFWELRFSGAWVKAGTHKRGTILKAGWVACSSLMGSCWNLSWIANISLSRYWLAGGFSTQRVNYTERGFMSVYVRNPSWQAFRKQLYRTMTLLCHWSVMYVFSLICPYRLKMNTYGLLCQRSLPKFRRSVNNGLA